MSQRRPSQFGEARLQVGSISLRCSSKRTLDDAGFSARGKESELIACAATAEDNVDAKENSLRVRVAIVTQGFDTGGGIPATSRWLRHELEATGYYSVDIHDLANSRTDANSRRLVDAKSWFRNSLKAPLRSDIQHWGANAVEIEAMRYRPRTELNKALLNYDLVQVVSGSPALAAAVAKVSIPKVVLAATMVKWERVSQLKTGGALVRTWRKLMTMWTSRSDLKALRRVDHVFVINSKMYEHVRSLGQSQVVIAPPGVDVANFTPNPDGWQSDGYLLSVCRLGDPRKGLDRAIRAYSELVQMMQHVPNLILAGRGALPADVLTLISQLNLKDRIEVRSDVPLVELVELMRGASIFLQTSHEEGLGISVLEAMACGLPVVATETAGSFETVANGESGWLVPQHDEQQLPQRIALCIKSIIETDGLEMSIKGRTRCETYFSSSETLSRITTVYAQLISAHRS